MKEFVYRFDDNIGGILGISIVDEPAVESNFLTFSKCDTMQLLKFDSKKRIVKGVAIRAGFKIPREGFTITFPREEIEKLMIRSMRDGFNSSLNHNGTIIDNKKVYLIESYILEKPDIDFPDIELGSWIVSYKIDDDSIWTEIQKGNLNGFSIEINIDLDKCFLFSKENLCIFANNLIVC